MELKGDDNVQPPLRVPMIPSPPETRASLILRLRDAADVAAWGTSLLFTDYSFGEDSISSI